MSNVVNPLVTIVTPSYNQGRFIRYAIESVLMQDYDNIEYIVVDGGSTDETLEILKEYGERIKWVSEPDDGQSNAINKGFKMASGEIVAWLNSDDTYELGAVRTAVDYFLRSEAVVLVYGDGYIIDEDNRKVKRFEWTQPYDLWTLINYADYIMQPTTFFRRRALEDIGYLDETLNWCMDWDLWIRLGLKYEVAYIDSVLANSREYDQTKTSTGGWRRFSEISRLMRKYSGSKFPPGYFVYGCATLYSSLQNYKIPYLAARYMLFVVQRHIERVLPRRYSDKWIGKQFKMLIRPGSNTLSLMGDIPLSRLSRQVITCYIDDIKVLEHRVEQGGQFSLKIKIPKNNASYPRTLEITCSHTVIPDKTNPSSRDYRRLGARLLGVEID